MIAIIDYSTGNLRSVANALQRIGAECIITSDEKIIRMAEQVILPGVGDASIAISKLRESGLDQVIKTLSQPVLGICVGMQLMCKNSEEGNVECLGVFDANVTKLNSIDHNSDKRLKIPHMGWNRVESLKTELFNDVDEGEFFYYVHSYAPEISDHTIATTIYGRKFSGALNNRNFYGTQFHPEKSDRAGEQLLKNFLKL